MVQAQQLGTSYRILSLWELFGHQLVWQLCMQSHMLVTVLHHNSINLTRLLYIYYLYTWRNTQPNHISVHLPILILLVFIVITMCFCMRSACNNIKVIYMCLPLDLLFCQKQVLCTIYTAILQILLWNGHVTYHLGIDNSVFVLQCYFLNKKYIIYLAFFFFKKKKINLMLLIYFLLYALIENKFLGYTFNVTIIIYTFIELVTYGLQDQGSSIRF